ncbi:hypothetical protein AZSI13_31300 [Azospira sp. I13]|uniref:hypothetical protein n=1 Tax=Azospira sp. I13 TaxID=1765050 RepID=UPI000D415046|nr:hypothetical protein [Azospira sp. I13]GBG03803.1 hypothetical protein AZSI13_31300 [Azospira sp. I13]
MPLPNQFETRQQQLERIAGNVQKQEYQDQPVSKGATGSSMVPALKPLPAAKAPLSPQGTDRDQGGIAGDVDKQGRRTSAGNSFSSDPGASKDGGWDLAGNNAQLEQSIRDMRKIQEMRGDHGAFAGLMSNPGAADSQAIHAKWDMENQLKNMSSRSRAQVLAAMLNKDAAVQNAQTNAEVVMAGQRNNQHDQNLLLRSRALDLQGERLGLIGRGQDLRDKQVQKRIDSQEDIAFSRITERSGLSLAQQRSNAEIAAARQAISGLSQDDIKRKTSDFTSTGRQNPDFDPMLAKSVALANRRMVGDDELFDAKQQGMAPAQGKASPGTGNDVLDRFKADTSMSKYRVGKETERGIEVLDQNGKLLGHYR